MTVFEVPNIEHCTIYAIGNPAVMYRVTAGDGWWLYLNDGDEANANLYQKVKVLRADRDWSQLEVVAEADLPPDAELADKDTETEVM